jgi:hypothetical protein
LMRLDDAFRAYTLDPALNTFTGHGTLRQNFQSFGRLHKRRRLDPGINDLLRHARGERTIWLNPDGVGLREKKPCGSRNSSIPIRQAGRYHDARSSPAGALHDSDPSDHIADRILRQASGGRMVSPRRPAVGILKAPGSSPSSAKLRMRSTPPPSVWPVDQRSRRHDLWNGDSYDWR